MSNVKEIEQIAMMSKQELHCLLDVEIEQLRKDQPEFLLPQEPLSRASLARFRACFRKTLACHLKFVDEFTGRLGKAKPIGDWNEPLDMSSSTRPAR